VGWRDDGGAVVREFHRELTLAVSELDFHGDALVATALEDRGKGTGDQPKGLWGELRVGSRVLNVDDFCLHPTLKDKGHRITRWTITPRWFPGSVCRDGLGERTG
jgi:hypothetical protein